MKNKLKMFFSYFKGLKVKTVDTDIPFDVNTIEPGWNEHFYLLGCQCCSAVLNL